MAEGTTVMPKRFWLPHLATICLQVGLLWLISWAGNTLATWLHIPIPGSLLGMVFLFLLMGCKVLRLQWFEQGADFLLRILVFLFVPPTVGIIDYGELLREHGIALLLSIMASTLCVLSVTGLVAIKWLPRKESRTFHE